MARRPEELRLFAVKLDVLKKLVSQKMEISTGDISDPATPSDFSYDKTPPEFIGGSSKLLYLGRVIQMI